MLKGKNILIGISGGIAAYKTPYFVWLWSKGQTLAMKTWNIRVVNHEGVELTQVRALIRYLYSWVWFLPPLAVTTIFNLDSLQGVLLIFG